MCCVELYDGNGRTAVYGYESGGLHTFRWGQSAFHVAVRRVHTHTWQLWWLWKQRKKRKGCWVHRLQAVPVLSISCIHVFCKPCPLECVARTVTSFE